MTRQTTTSAVRAGGHRDAWAVPGFLQMLTLGLVFLILAGCQPTVKIEAPDKPIEINLNVRIEQEVRIKVDRDLDDLLASNPDLF